MANDNKLVNLADLKEAFDTLKTNASQSAAGLMSATDKTKLNGIAEGATKTAVKGNSESSYRTGNVNLTAANVGAPSTDGSGASGTWGINITGNASTATKATQDGDGNVIASTYLPKGLPGGYVGDFDYPGASVIQLKNTSSGTNPSSVIGGNNWLVLSNVYDNILYSGQLAIGFDAGIAWRGKYNTTTWGRWRKIAFADDICAPSSAFSIPASGSSVSYNLTGITTSHELIRWNFSSSAENAPPVDLSWNTQDGYFTITNNGGTTSESIKPIFALPNAVTTTDH